MPPSKWGLGFLFFVSAVPYWSKAVRQKPLLKNMPIFAERLLRGIKVNSSHGLFLFLKLLSVAVLENKNKICVPLCLFGKCF